MASKTTKSKSRRKKNRKSPLWVKILCGLFIILCGVLVYEGVLNISLAEDSKGEKTVVVSVNIPGLTLPLGEDTTSPEKSTTPVQPEAEKGQTAKSGEKYVPSDTLFIPKCKHGSDHERRDLTGYSLCYRESYEQAEWAAACLTRDRMKKAADRTDNFRSDPKISTGSASPADYKSSGYDRGHLVPAADLSWSEQSMSESFYMSNMSPQVPGFNRGIWNQLEAQVRDWAREFGTVYTVSGPILEKKKYPVIGENEVAVPEFYYKALLAHTDSDEWYAIGFILPNDSSDESIMTFAVPVDEVEKRCNIDFFYELPDEIENSIEKKVDYNFWK